MNKFSLKENAMSTATVCHATVIRTCPTLAARFKAELIRLLSQMATRR